MSVISTRSRIEVATANTRCCESDTPAACQNGTGGVVLAEHVGAFDGEQRGEPRAGTMDPALDRPYRAIADRGGLVVRET